MHQHQLPDLVWDGRGGRDGRLTTMDEGPMAASAAQTLRVAEGDLDRVEHKVAVTDSPSGAFMPSHWRIRRRCGSRQHPNQVSEVGRNTS